MALTSGRVLVAGADGQTGVELLHALKDTTFRVRALTRSRDDEAMLRGLGADEVVVGDLFDPADAAAATEGVDAVLCAVGTSGLKAGIADLFGRELVDGTGVRNLVDAAVDAGATQFVLESAIGVGSSRPRLPLPARMLVHPTLIAKGEAEEHLRGSGLTYTVVRPGGLTDEPATGDVVVAEGGDTVTGTVPRADVARFMLRALATPAAENHTFEVVSREGLLGAARGVVHADWVDPTDGTRATDDFDETAGA